MSASPRPLLLLIAHGLRAQDLAGLTAAEPAAATPLQLTGVPTEPERVIAGAADASAALWDLGIAVDRSPVCLRPAGRSDTSALENLRRRPTGPAPVTLLTSTFAHDLGLAEGRTRDYAIAEVDAHLQTAKQILRSGDQPEVWLLACGAWEPVLVTFDFAGAWQRRFAWPWRRSLRASVAAERATIVANDQQALQCAAAVLQRSPFREHGTLTMPRAGTLTFTARAGVGFGRRRVFARPSTSTCAAALTPNSGEPLPDELPFEEWLARFWLRAQSLHSRSAVTADRAAQAPGTSQPATTLQKMTLPSPGA